MIWKTIAAAGITLAFSATIAAADPTRVLSNTNLRLGPGTNFGVVTTVPGGSIVEVSSCGGQWCTAHWGGRTGYMIATNLALSGPVGGPPVAVYDPAPSVYVGGPYWYGPRRYYGYGPRYYRGGWRRW
jgi:uncharacterized protein YraI